MEEPSQLPVRGVVLRRIYHEMKTNKTTLPVACSIVADEVLSIWVKANIKTITKPYVVAKLKSIHQEHVHVSKHKQRWTMTQLTKEDNFTTWLSQLFDIAHADWRHHTKNLEDRQFLIDQRGPRQMVMSNEDLNYRKAAAKHKKRKQDEECRHQRHTAELAQASAAVEFSLPSESSSNEDNVSLDQPYCPTAKRKKKHAINIFVTGKALYN